jgi:hypothetical protein
MYFFVIVSCFANLMFYFLQPGVEVVQILQTLNLAYAIPLNDNAVCVPTRLPHETPPRVFETWRAGKLHIFDWGFPNAIFCSMPEVGLDGYQKPAAGAFVLHASGASRIF